MKNPIYSLILLSLFCSHSTEPLSSLPIVGTWDNSGNINNECDSLSFQFNANYSYVGTIVKAVYQPIDSPGVDPHLCVKSNINLDPLYSNWKTNNDTIYFEPPALYRMSSFIWYLSKTADTLYLRNITINEYGFHTYRKRK
jgi:hypothetical protein